MLRHYQTFIIGNNNHDQLHLQHCITQHKSKKWTKTIVFIQLNNWPHRPCAELCFFSPCLSHGSNCLGPCSPLLTTDKACCESCWLFRGSNRILSRHRVFSHESVCLCWGEKDHMTRAAVHTARSADISSPLYSLVSALRFAQLLCLHSRVWRVSIIQWQWERILSLGSVALPLR